MNRNGIIVQNNIHSGKFIARSWQMHLFDNINHNVNILTHPVLGARLLSFRHLVPAALLAPATAAALVALLALVSPLAPASVSSV